MLDINTKISTRWKEYVEHNLKQKCVTFNSGTKWTMTDEGVFVEYSDRIIRLTVDGNARKFLAIGTIKQRYGKGGTAFERNILGVVNYSSANRKTQQKAIQDKNSNAAVIETPKLRRDQNKFRKNPFVDIARPDESAKPDASAQSLDTFYEYLLSDRAEDLSARSL